MQGVLAANQGPEHDSSDTVKAQPLQDQTRAIYIQVSARYSVAGLCFVMPPATSQW
jgi:hypothetical protein